MALVAVRIRIPRYGDFDPRTWPPVDDAPDNPRYISLSNRIDSYCIVDDIDYQYLRHYNWCHTYGSGSYNENGVIDRPNHIYARRSVTVPDPTAKNGKRKSNLWMHKVICARAYGLPEPGFNIGDHINGNTLDNRRANLRWATRSMNARNKSGSAERAELLLLQRELERMAA